MRAEWVGPHDDEKLGFLRSPSTTTIPAGGKARSTPHYLINLTKWNELPKQYQSAVITASNDAWVWTLRNTMPLILLR